MPRRNRRRTLIGIATLVFGASGFVASGAFTTGSQGSLGDNWIQVAGTDQTVTLNSLEQVDVEDDSDSEDSGGGNDGEESDDGSETGEGEDGNNPGGDETDGDETDGDEESTEDDSPDDSTGGGGSTVSTSVEVLVDPSGANGLNSGGPARWRGSIFETEYVTGTADGYLRGIRNEEINQNANTRIGDLTDRPPGDNVVFLIANVGPEDTTTVAPPVTVTMRLLSNGEAFTTDQMRFPYRVLDTDQNSISSGDNLATASGIELATGEIIEVAIVFDTSDGASDLELISDIQFFATE